jgi:hypothetical protein
MAMYSRDLGKDILFLNIYGPYKDKLNYWDKIFHWRWSKQGLTIIVGDLNFTLGASEVWDPAAQVDYLMGYFLRKLEAVGLVDIEPAKVNPAYRNNGAGEARIAKRLNSFLFQNFFLRNKSGSVSGWLVGVILIMLKCYWNWLQ